jgi:NAD/NADP transhydrogenase alpha subunit
VRISVPKETRPGENRVALVPDIISKLTRAGLEVVIESGAGVAAQFSDEQFTKAGATVKSGNVISDSDVVASIQPLTPDQMKLLKKAPSQSPSCRQRPQLTLLRQPRVLAQLLSHLNLFRVSLVLSPWMRSPRKPSALDIAQRWQLQNFHHVSSHYS